MFVDFDPASSSIDNAHTGRFWTRVDGDILKGVQSPMQEPRLEDWR
jgi:hypothetical protein